MNRIPSTGFNLAGQVASMFHEDVALGRWLARVPLTETSSVRCEAATLR